MPNNNTKFDIGSQVRQVAELNEALKSLHQVSQSLFSNLGRLADTFGSSLKSASQPLLGLGAPATAEDATTAVGRNMIARRQYEVQKAQQLVGTIEAGLASGEIQEDFDKGVFYQNIGKATSAGRRVRTTVATREQLDQALAISRREKEDRQQSNFQAAVQNAGYQVAPASPAQDVVSQVTGDQARRSLAGLGYREADIGRIMLMQPGAAEQARRLGTLAPTLGQSADPQIRALGTIVEKLGKELTSNQKDFSEQLNEYTRLITSNAGPEAVAQQLEKLKTAMGSLESTLKDATQAEKDGQKLAGGPGGPGGGGGFGALVNKYGRFASAIAGAAITGAEMYGHADIGLRQQVLNAELRSATTRGAISSQTFDIALASVDMTKAENLMKYRADILFPERKFEYIGFEGNARAARSAQAMASDEILLQQRQRMFGMLGAAGQVGLGALGLLGSAATGGGLGLLLGAGSISQILSGAGSLASTWTNSPYTALTGGLNQGVTGAFGRFTQGDRYTSNAQFAQAAQYAMTNQGMLERFQGLMDAEMQAKRPTTMGIQAQLDFRQIQRSAVSELGRYAPSAKNVNDILRIGIERFRSVDELRGLSLSNKVEGLNTNELNVVRALQRADRAENLRNNARDNFHPQFSIFGNDADLMNARKFGEASRDFRDTIAETGRIVGDYQQSIAYRSNRATRLLMTNQEFMQGMAQVGAAWGPQALDDDMKATRLERVTALSRAGLGDTSAILGNIGEISRATGGTGDQALNRLEKVLTSAVSVGFDRSRLAQSFVQTTSQLSRSLGTTDVVGTASRLGTLSAAMGINFRTDERSLQEAATSYAQYGAITKQTGGLLGAGKMMSIFGGGGTIKTGAFSLAAMSAPEASAMIDQLESGSISDRRINQMLAMSGGDTKENRSALIQQLKNARAGSTGVMAAQFNLAYMSQGTTLDQELSQLKNLKDASGKGGKAYQQQLLKIQGMANQVGALFGYGSAAEAFVMDLALERGALSKTDKRSALDKAKAEGAQKYLESSEGLKGVLEYTNSIISQGAQATERIADKEEYRKYLEKTKAPIRFKEGKLQGQLITKEMLDSTDLDVQSDIEKTLRQTSRLDLAQQAQVMSSLGNEGVQKVWVMNTGDFAAAFRFANSVVDKKTDPNATGSGRSPFP
jgi:hypothetical protein